MLIGNSEVLFLALAHSHWNTSQILLRWLNKIWHFQTFIHFDVVISENVILKGPCHTFPVITRPLVCYEGFYACKRCAESQTLKVQPVASKTLPKTPRWRYVIVHLILPFSSGYGMMSSRTRNEMDQSVEPLRYVRGAVALSPRWLVQIDQSTDFLTHICVQGAGSSADFSSLAAGW